MCQWTYSYYCRSVYVFKSVELPCVRRLNESLFLNCYFHPCTVHLLLLSFQPTKAQICTTQYLFIWRTLVHFSTSLCHSREVSHVCLAKLQKFLKLKRLKVQFPAFIRVKYINPLNPELNPICYLLALLAHHFLHVSRIRVKSLTIRLLMSCIYIYIYGAPILDVSRSHTTTHHSR